MAGEWGPLTNYKLGGDYSSAQAKTSAVIPGQRNRKYQNDTFGEDSLCEEQKKNKENSGPSFIVLIICTFNVLLRNVIHILLSIQWVQLLSTSVVEFSYKPLHIHLIHSEISFNIFALSQITMKSECSEIKKILLPFISDIVKQIKPR